MLPSIPFYMIRHGESEANVAQYASGHMDVPLTDNGIRQARQAAMVLSSLSEKPTHIIHSPLQRAHNTALILNEPLGLPITEDDGIKEQHFGAWEGLSWEKTRQSIRDGIDPPEGETHETFHNRVRDAISRHLKRAQETRDSVLFVSHGGVFRAFGALYGTVLSGINNARLYRFTPDHSGSTPLPWVISPVDSKG